MDVRSDYNLSISSFLSPCTEIFGILDGKYQDWWRYYMSSEVISWYSFQQYFGFPKVAMCFDGTLIRVWESDQNPILQMQPPPRWTLLLPHKILNNWTDQNPRIFLSQYYILFKTCLSMLFFILFEHKVIRNRDGNDDDS